MTQSLAAAAEENVVRNLQMTAECRELRDRFEAAGVPLLFLKGLTLGALAYGSPTPKAAIDIDLLVDPADLPKAASLLRGCGYRAVTPHDCGDERAIVRWHRRSKESLWAKHTVQVDLHTRTADNPRLISGIDVHSTRQLVDIGGGLRLPTLGHDELFAYLAVHGAASGWFRLKWISDFAGFVDAVDQGEIDVLYRRSQELGAGRTTAQALLLADALFGTLDRQPGLRARLLGDRATRILLRTALALVSRKPAEPTERLMGTLPMHWMPFLFRSGWAYGLSEISSQAGRFLNRFRS